MTGATARITAVICTYDRYPLLDKAIASLRRQTLTDFRILIVDNSPDDALAEQVARRYAEVGNLTYLIERRPGIANARNVGAKATETEFVAYLDDDMVAEPDWLARLLAIFDSQGRDVAVVGGKVLPDWQAPRPPWLPDSLLGYISVVDWGGETRDAGLTEWLSGGNVVFRQAELLAAGAFRADLGRSGSGANLLSNEDLEVLERVRRAGHRIIYTPNAVTHHLVPADRLTRAWFRRRAAWQAASDFLTDPVAAGEEVRRSRRELIKRLRGKPLRRRAIKLLSAPTDDPRLFERQIRANYLLVMAELAGLEDHQ